MVELAEAGESGASAFGLHEWISELHGFFPFNCLHVSNTHKTGRLADTITQGKHRSDGLQNVWYNSPFQDNSLFRITGHLNFVNTLGPACIAILIHTHTQKVHCILGLL